MNTPVDIDTDKIDVWSNKEKFKELLNPFKYRSFSSGLRLLIDNYALTELPNVDAYSYEAVALEDEESTLKSISTRPGYVCRAVTEFDRGCEMLANILSGLYQTSVTISMTMHGPESGIILSGSDIVFVLDISAPSNPELSARTIAVYSKRGYPVSVLDDIIPSTMDRSINEPAFLLSSKMLDRATCNGRYSREYTTELLVEAALSRGWYRVERFGNQLLFVAELRLN